MGHHISAIVARGEANRAIAEEYGTTVVKLQQEFVMIPVNAWQSDHWCEQLGLDYGNHKPIILDGAFAHYLANEALQNERFAIINTDYNGGVGSQAAVVYENGIELMPTETTQIMRTRKSRKGPISKALRLLGAQCLNYVDEFEAVGIHSHRHFDDLFESYYED